MAIENGDQVRIEYVGRFPDGTVFDTSREAVAAESGLVEEQPDREYEPLSVEVGSGRIIEGLDDLLLGMEAGETDSATLPPEKAYGEPSDDQVVEYEPETFRQALQGEAEPEEGMHVQGQNGELGEVVHVDPDVVRVDFNHELAGETIEFEVEVVDVE